MTIRQALDHAADRLAGVSSSSRRDAEILLRHVLGCSLAALLAFPDRELSALERTQYEALIQRRLNSEPIQYILGEQEFYGLSFEVNPDVLIPRPETEILVEAFLERVSRPTKLRIVDVGVGSGAIAVTLAHSLPHAELTAVDISAPALAVAHKNALRHGVAGRIRFIQADLLHGFFGAGFPEAEFSDAGFDAVISNPPYVAAGELLDRQVYGYEPHAALFAGPTGLEIYERLIPQARRVLNPEGWLLLEIGYGQKDALLRLFAEWKDVSFEEDLQGIPRVAIARRPA